MGTLNLRSTNNQANGKRTDESSVKLFSALDKPCQLVSAERCYQLEDLVPS